jgi:hypothetical protein
MIVTMRTVLGPSSTKSEAMPLRKSTSSASSAVSQPNTAPATSTIAPSV